MGMESKFIWKNGELLDFEKASVHMLTAALHYGAAVFEGIRAYKTDKGSAIFRLREHSERLIKSAEIFGFRDLPFTADDVFNGCKETVKANGFDECYVRPLLYLSGGAWNLNIDAGNAEMMIAVWEWSNYLGDEDFQSFGSALPEYSQQLFHRSFRC